MSDQDKELVEKGAVKQELYEKVRVYTHNTTVEFWACGDVLTAIDALKPVAEVQGAVSRKAVLKRLIAFRQALKRTAPTEELIGAEITELRRQIREDLPSVLPAESRRSEEEIEGAINRLKKGGRGEQGEMSVSIFTGRQVALILEYALGLPQDKAMPIGLAKLFAPPSALSEVEESDSNQEKGKEGNK